MLCAIDCNQYELSTEDSAEHYCVCSVISDAMLKRNMAPSRFMGRRAWALVSVELSYTEDLCKIGCFIYATNIVTCRIRHGDGLRFLDRGDVVEAVLQSTKEAVKGHRTSSDIMAKCWSTSTTATQIAPLGDMNPSLSRLARARL